MKKLMFSAVVAIGLAGAANASAVQWAIGADDFVDHTGAAITSGGTGFLYLLTGAGQGPTWSSTSGWNMNGATLLTTSAYNDDVTGWGSDQWTKYSQVISGTTSGAEQQYFALLVTEASGVSTLDGYEGYVAWVNPSIQGVQKVETSEPLAYGTFVNDWNTSITQNMWVDTTQVAPTPEPTTGLLVLLGVAGLALRRKQA